LKSEAALAKNRSPLKRTFGGKQSKVEAARSKYL